MGSGLERIEDWQPIGREEGYCGDALATICNATPGRLHRPHGLMRGPAFEDGFTNLSGAKAVRRLPIQWVAVAGETWTFAVGAKQHRKTTSTAAGQLAKLHQQLLAVAD